VPTELLVIHGSELLRKVLVSYAMAEINDARVETSGTPSEGLSRLAEKKFDAVICALDMPGMDGLVFKSEMRKTGFNEATPMILLTPGATEEDHLRMIEAGVEQCLSVPYTRGDLARAVEALVDQRQKRGEQRIGLEGTAAVLRQNQSLVTGHVINLCTNGMLIEVEWPDLSCVGLKASDTTLIFPPHYDSVNIEHLQTKLLRFTVITWYPDASPHLVRMARQILDAPPVSRTLLNDILKQIGQDMTVIDQLWDEELEYFGSTTEVRPPGRSAGRSSGVKELNNNEK
jgi:CheY-like chemotaxis protein